MELLPAVLALLGAGGLGAAIVQAVTTLKAKRADTTQARLDGLVDTLQEVADTARERADDAERRFRILEGYIEALRQGISDGSIPPMPPYPTDVWRRND